ncbi:exodeoxyribonuclease V subunit gamma [Aliagarivorans taiwanensis]|uniref:exodeoxyribonuclease V subunit gamma n=1 Tax=Aliagarivorans taiwanensis TaxID=561966 RepID=UPI0003FE05C5|nr:exodeoxyribonuclease V subunit gamma [Aliagarivorans taiwanensis]
MLTIYQSNLTEKLLDTLADVYQQRPAGCSVFEPEQILVQNPDMAQWLKISLAEKQGIAANIQFPLPSSFLWQIFKQAFSSLPEQSPFAKSAMTWTLMRLLPQHMSEPEFQWMQSELADAQPERQQQKLFSLCSTIADTFDQYLMYRPGWIASWEQDEQVEGLGDQQQWQARLWRMVSNDITARAGSDLHRGRLLQQTLEVLDHSDHLQIRGLPPRIAIFGLSSLPEQTMLLLNALAKHIDIHWFQLNPCEHFWLDIVDEKALAKIEASKLVGKLEDLDSDHYYLVGNPLLASFGGLGRENLSLMLEKLESDLYEQYFPFPSTGALNYLQQQILHLECRGQFDALSPQQLSSNDDKQAFEQAELANLRFHQCYSPLRELEVLKDQLFALFDSDPSLSPNDVVVMMPDVSIYAPFIRGVFAYNPQRPSFPFSISDLSAVQQSVLANSLLQIFSLPESRFGLSEVLALLEVPATLARFDISEDEFDLLKHWLRDVGVRWGVDAEHRAQFGVGDFEQNSWLFGLKRMLLGYAMHPSMGDYADTLPFDEIEGAQAQALGKFSLFIERLEQTSELLTQSHTAEQWLECVNQVLSDFYIADEQGSRDIKAVVEAMQAFRDTQEQTGYEQPVSREIVRELLFDTLNAAQSSRRFKAGAINFCSLMPMRSIPFKVVCLLGMNDGDFPRQNPTISFDLMQKQRRRGDRSRRLDDRYLFLEALLSCRQHLHISWVGKDIRSDQELPPSVLLMELRDYIAESWLVSGDECLAPDKAGKQVLHAMTFEHPLQAFNAQYYQQGSPLHSYSQFWAVQPQLPEPFSDAELGAQESVEQRLRVELSEVAAALSNPCRYFLQRRLGVYFDGVAEQVPDSEPFALDALSGWQLKQQAFVSRFYYQNVPGFKRQQGLTGSLPVGDAGERKLEEAISASDSLMEYLPDALRNPSVPQEFRLSLGDDLPELLGQTVAPIEGRLWRVKNGNLSAKDRLHGWLQHLVSAALGVSADSVLIDDGKALLYRALPQELALEYLQQAIGVFTSAQHRALPFFLNSGFSWLANQRLEPEALQQKLEAAWAPQDIYSAHKGDGNDPYIQRCHPLLAPVYPEFVKHCATLLKPIEQHTQWHEVRKKQTDMLSHSAFFKFLEQEGAHAGP